MSKKQLDFTLSRAIKVVQTNVMEDDILRDLEELGIHELKELNNSCDRIHSITKFFKSQDGRVQNKICDILGGVKYHIYVPLVFREMDETKLI